MCLRRVEYGVSCKPTPDLPNRRLQNHLYAFNGFAPTYPLQGGADARLTPEIHQIRAAGPVHLLCRELPHWREDIL